MSRTSRKRPFSLEESGSDIGPLIYDNSCPRSGKWTLEEETFANRLISEFESGFLTDCEEGSTLRSYLAKKLNCAPMRISKKFAGRCIGKHVFTKKDRLMDSNPLKTKSSLNKLEDDFRKSSYKQQFDDGINSSSSSTTTGSESATYQTEGSISSDDGKEELLPRFKSQKFSSSTFDSFLQFAYDGPERLVVNDNFGLDIDEMYKSTANDTYHDFSKPTVEAEEWRDVLAFFSRNNAEDHYRNTVTAGAATSAALMAKTNSFASFLF